MKRWPLRILICLVLGAITTVAVAWGIGILSDFRRGTFDSASEFNEQHDWYVQVGRGTGTLLVDSLRATVSGQHTGGRPVGRGDPKTIVPSWAHKVIHSNIVTSARFGDFDGRRLEATGWPIPALWRGWQYSTATDYLQSAELIGGLATSINSGRAYGYDNSLVLPTRIVWPGFLIDTLFYAAIWFGVFFGFTSAKRFIRAKRGRCPRCGYDLRGQRNAVVAEQSKGDCIRCPECGWSRTRETVQ